ncbi:hypothetical protein P280DRAFT_510569 [Massarina eburnea CBS 473.64]|uniref:Uncharacterized protein n=1 Tax=Massarina eburnea CBS 473.64 TaxID=1395130 RepID=A0A6A6RMG3_9PLEO|nr:hypothetical protein P280DRAFT_510569 [Massarina eburnea CBS 473.64]
MSDWIALLRQKLSKEQIRKEQKTTKTNVPPDCEGDCEYDVAVDLSGRRDPGGGLQNQQSTEAQQPASLPLRDRENPKREMHHINKPITRMHKQPQLRNISCVGRDLNLPGRKMKPRLFSKLKKYFSCKDGSRRPMPDLAKTHGWTIVAREMSNEIEYETDSEEDDDRRLTIDAMRPVISRRAPVAGVQVQPEEEQGVESGLEMEDDGTEAVLPRSDEGTGEEMYNFASQQRKRHHRMVSRVELPTWTKTVYGHPADPTKEKKWMLSMGSEKEEEGAEGAAGKEKRLRGNERGWISV